MKYIISYKKPGERNFTEFPATGTITRTDDNIMIDSLPIDLQVQVTDITPQPASSVITMKIGDAFMIKRSSTIFQTTVTEKKDQEIVITITDEQGTKIDKVIKLSLNQSIIEGVLKSDIYAGPEPLTVNLDASTTKLNDENDEIIYFTWDFGDGETAKNVSQGKLSHIYRFDQKNQSGQYRPKVTVTTKNGFQSTFFIDTPISVTRKESTVKLSLPSHPTQVATRNSMVEMEMSSDGPITKISWNFGDGSTFSCNDRSCSNISHIYKEA